MAKQLKLRRGTTSQHSSFTGAEGEVTVDTDKESLVVHNGSTAGGFAIARADSPDNQKTRWGTGNDLEIYHDGSLSYIRDVGTGGFRIDSNAFEVLNAADTEYIIKTTENNKVELYYDGVRKLYTDSDGVVVQGNLYLSTADNHKLILGDGQDLQIYHNGSQSIINNQTGNLSIQTSGNLWIENQAGSEVFIKAVANGAVELYYDSSKKFATKSSGVDFFGDTFMPDGESAHYGTGNDMYMGHSGSYSYIEDTSADFRLHSNSVKLQSYTGGEEYLVATYNGSVDLYYNDSKKFETTNTGVSISSNAAFPDNGKAIFGAGDDLQIFHDGTGCNLRSTSSKLEIRSNDLLLQSSGAEKYFRGLANAQVELYFDGTKKFETATDGVVINDSVKYMAGNSADLQIYHDGTNSSIKNSTGQLSLLSNAFGVCNEGFSENMIRADVNSSVRLYFDHSKKIETTSSGAQVTGNLRVDGSLDLYDGKNIRLGDSADLQMWHSGSNSYITNTTGDLYITDESLIRLRTDDFRVYRGNDSELIFRGVVNGACSLYYDNSKKFETFGSGVKMWGDGGGNGEFHHDNTTGNNNRYFEIRNSRSGNGRGRTAGIWIGENSNSQGDLYCRSGGGNADVSGGVRISNGSSSWSTVSDMRLKDKTGDITNALVDIAKIEAIKFTWKSDADKTPQVGVSAQSVENVVPEAISKNREHDLEKLGDNTEYMGVRYTELVPLCIAALQEAKVKIETLETKVAALEAG